MVLEYSININASAAKVWSVFTDAEITRRMGGEYISEWQPGSFFGWRGKEGILYTHGKILEIEKERLLKHQLFDGPEQTKLSSIITYILEYTGKHTLLLAKEEIMYPLDKASIEGLNSGWNSGLNAVKEIAESL